jgi:hypothetical protein
MARLPVIPLAVSGLLLLGAGGAGADGRLDFAAAQLATAKDPRLRAQAALVLAALKSPAALAPLCASLEDPSPLVRTAAARALGTLGGAGALECLKRHRDADAYSRAEVGRAVAALETRARPRVYVSLGAIRDPAGRLGAAAEALAERELRAALAETGGVLVAPKGESLEEGCEIIRRKGLKAYQLSVSLKAEPGGDLSMAVLLLNFPDRTLIGDLALSAQGTDTEGLIRLLAPIAVERAAKTLDWSQP